MVCLLVRYEGRESIDSIVFHVSAYMFSPLAAVLFCFYSVTRHAIAATYPPSSSGTYCTKVAFYSKHWFVPSCTLGLGLFSLRVHTNFDSLLLTSGSADYYSQLYFFLGNDDDDRFPSTGLEVSIPKA
jgi:hypothetical protein